MSRQSALVIPGLRAIASAIHGEPLGRRPYRRGPSRKKGHLPQVISMERITNIL